MHDLTRGVVADGGPWLGNQRCRVRRPRQHRAAASEAAVAALAPGAPAYVARGHIIPTDISAGSAFGVRSAENDVDVRERQVVQNAVDQLAAAGIDVHGEMIEATEHDAADIIVQRAKELDVDIIVLGYQHHRGSVVAEHVIRQRPHCSILLARPPDEHPHRR